METRSEDRVLNFFLGLLILTAFCSGVVIELGIATANLSQIAAILLIILLVIYSAIKNKSALVLYTDRPSLFLYLYFVSNLFSSLLFSPVKGQSIKGCMVIASYIMIYISVRWAMKFILDHKVAVKKLLRYNLWSAVLGLVCMVTSLAQSGRENIGVSLGQLGTARIETVENPLPSIQSLSIEPNIFAIITATLLVLNLSIYLLTQKSKKKLLIIILLSTAVLFAYTRSVYLALFISLFFLIIFAQRARLLISVANYVVIILVLITTLFIFLPNDNDVKNALVSRATTLMDFSKGSGAGRVIGYQIAYEGFKNHPLAGNGTLSAKTEFYNKYKKKYQERMGSAGWLNGVLIQSMHDTGIVGILIYFGLCASLVLANFSVYRTLENSSVEKSIVLGFITGNIILLIASQASSTLWISFPYIYWGINMAFIKWCKEEIIGTTTAAK
jgi:O-antigen ligase